MPTGSRLAAGIGPIVFFVDRNHMGRHADGKGPIGHICKHNAAGSYSRPVADPDAAKQGGSGSNEDTSAYVRMAVSPFAAGAAKGNVVKQSDIV